MKTIQLINILASLADLLEQAQEEALILQIPCGQKFVLTAMDDFAHKVELTQQNPSLMALLDHRERSNNV